MASTFVKNIKLLAGTRDENFLLKGKQLAKLPTIENAFLIIQDGLIAAYGKMDDFVYRNSDFSQQVDAMGQTVLPAWCDSHTHLVFAQSREQEFLDKIRGLTYAEIAARGGGILNSARKLNATSENELFHLASERLDEVSRLGTGAIEIKSGYGLTTEGELKMLRVIKRLKERSNLSIKTTFLGAHSYPVEYKDDHQGYIDLIINEMLPSIAAEKLADYIDVFCESGFFSPEETETICKAGMRYG
jgi:imidazolonepropionase